MRVLGRSKKWGGCLEEHIGGTKNTVGVSNAQRKGLIRKIDTPQRTEEMLHVIPLNMNAIMDFFKKSEYPEKRLTYLGNAEIEYETPCYTNLAYYGWYRLEENWLCSFYLQWRNKTYRQEKECGKVWLN